MTEGQSSPGAPSSPPPAAAPGNPPPAPGMPQVTPYPSFQGYILVPTYLPPRKQSNAALIVVIVVVVVVIVSIMLAAILYILVAGFIGPGSPVSSGTPIGGALSLGSAHAGSGPHPTVWFENVSIAGASSSLVIDDLAFTVETSEGAEVSDPSGSLVNLINSSGESIATYSFSTASWTGVSPSTSVTAQDSLSMVWAAASSTDPLTGDLLVVAGLNGFTGTESVGLA